VVIPGYFGDPADFRRCEVTPIEVYAMPLQAADFRAYWSKNTWRNIVKTRNKTGDLTVAMDDPDALEWLVARWEANWVGHESDEIGAADDLRAVWPELLARGHLKTITLVAGSTPVAAYAMAVRGKTVMGLVTARDKSWTRGSLGIRVLIETMEAARAAGFERLEMGGYFTYKHRFAPSGGIHHMVHIRPMLPGRLDAVARCWRRLGSRTMGKLRSGQ
jgi:CelD/BcsL family acetyltransferase involved in cellulose biosynthesis